MNLNRAPTGGDPAILFLIVAGLKEPWGHLWWRDNAYSFRKKLNDQIKGRGSGMNLFEQVGFLPS